ncbi:HAD-like protein [Aspergillus terreus]|uniref:HAD-like protein n=1 Tax=Aspergillus terreus TaxID=33178 RepID=A0A5M3Z0F7_ASPTE|nr:hypothetical protein ATETN484_0005033300 [Aspergillus terreus]GFF16998.1 HAD-like protein [Aspergillus terreus]
MDSNSTSKLPAIVIQVDGVLVKIGRSATRKIPVPIPFLKRLQSTCTWMRYECNEINEQQCYEMLGKQFGSDASELRDAVSTIRDMVDYDKNLVSKIRRLKSESGGLLEVIAVWNIAKPEYESLYQRWGGDFLLDFDVVFTSFAAGARMPHIGFYHQFLTFTRTEPTNAVFVGGDLQNVVTARSLGMRGIVFDASQRLARTLLNTISDPLLRGNAFLQRNAKNLHPFTDCGTTLLENYVQLLILEVTGDEDLIVYKKPDNTKECTWNYYIEQPTFTKMNPPNDLDTTCLALRVVPHEDTIVQSLLDKMLEYLDTDGIIQVYFDHERPRVDPVVCVNVFLAFHIHRREHELQRTIDWIYQVLLYRAYIDGTYYYQTAEWFLFYLSRLLKQTQDANLEGKFGSLLRERIQERIGIPGDSLVLGMRLSVCHAMGVPNYQDMETLTGMQCEDGGWEPGYLYSIPIVGKRIFDRGFTTALAIQVIKESRLNQ